MRSVVDVERLRSRRTAMDDGITPFEHRDVDCSGRSLATLLVAWVGAAMMASVLLRWKYMWIALTILTLLFLFACGYATCNARRAHARVLMNEETRILERQRRNRNIQSVSGEVDNGAEVTEPPAYQAYWITDLPPPYATVIGAEPPPVLPRSSESEPPSLPCLSNPPPYSVAVQTEAANATQTSNPVSTRLTNRAGTSSPERRQSIVDDTTVARRERNLGTPIAWDDDKVVTTEQSETTENSSQNNSHTVLATRTQYLSNIISCTFGRGTRRNAERNDTVRTTTTRIRPDISQLRTIAVSNVETTSRINATTL